MGSHLDSCHIPLLGAGVIPVTAWHCPRQLLRPSVQPGHADWPVRCSSEFSIWCSASVSLANLSSLTPSIHIIFLELPQSWDVKGLRGPSQSSLSNFSWCRQENKVQTGTRFAHSCKEMPARQDSMQDPPITIHGNFRESLPFPSYVLSNIPNWEPQFVSAASKIRVAINRAGLLKFTWL